MLKRLYIHNFRTFENFELKPEGRNSSLLLGKNGSGKSSIGEALRLLQGIGRGVNQVGQLVKPGHFFMGRTDLPMRFELEVLLQDKLYRYTLALELPGKFKQLRVLEEQLEFDGHIVYAREQAQVSLRKGTGVTSTSGDARFLVDWHLIALPLIAVQSNDDPVHILRTWLAQMVVIAPIPQLMKGESDGETLMPDQSAGNIMEWLVGLLLREPGAYAQIHGYLKKIMPDLADFRNEVLANGGRRLVITFRSERNTLSVNFEDLSDGEKCFFLSAIVVASNKAYGPIFCFWDEPDNYLSLGEVGYFVLHLRREFARNNGQIIMTSHSEEAMRKFSHENTWMLSRASHLEPSQIQLLEDLAPDSDVVQSLLLGDLGA